MATYTTSGTGYWTDSQCFGNSICGLQHTYQIKSPHTVSINSDFTESFWGHITVDLGGMLYITNSGVFRCGKIMQINGCFRMDPGSTLIFTGSRTPNSEYLGATTLGRAGIYGVPALQIRVGTVL